MNQSFSSVEDDEDVHSQMKWALAQDYRVFLAEEDPIERHGLNVQRSNMQ